MLTYFSPVVLFFFTFRWSIFWDIDCGNMPFLEFNGSTQLYIWIATCLIQKSLLYDQRIPRHFCFFKFTLKKNKKKKPQAPFSLNNGSFGCPFTNRNLPPRVRVENSTSDSPKVGIFKTWTRCRSLSGSVIYKHKSFPLVNTPLSCHLFVCVYGEMTDKGLLLWKSKVWTHPLIHTIINK